MHAYMHTCTHAHMHIHTHHIYTRNPHTLHAHAPSHTPYVPVYALPSDSIDGTEVYSDPASPLTRRCVPNGYALWARGRCITLFSAPDYCGRWGNIPHA